MAQQLEGLRNLHFNAQRIGDEEAMAELEAQIVALGGVKGARVRRMARKFVTPESPEHGPEEPTE